LRWISSIAVFRLCPNFAQSNWNTSLVSGYKWPC